MALALALRRAKAFGAVKRGVSKDRYIVAWDKLCVNSRTIEEGWLNELHLNSGSVGPDRTLARQTDSCQHAKWQVQPLSEDARGGI